MHPNAFCYDFLHYLRSLQDSDSSTDQNKRECRRQSRVYRLNLLSTNKELTLDRMSFGSYPRQLTCTKRVRITTWSLKQRYRMSDIQKCKNVARRFIRRNKQMIFLTWKTINWKWSASSSFDLKAKMLTRHLKKSQTKDVPGWQSTSALRLLVNVSEQRRAAHGYWLSYTPISSTCPLIAAPIKTLERGFMPKLSDFHCFHFSFCPPPSNTVSIHSHTYTKHVVQSFPRNCFVPWL